MREKYRPNRSKKKTHLKKGYVVVAITIIILIIAVVYVLQTIPPSPNRNVEVQLVDPPGLVYNSTSDELRLWLNFTPSDDDLYLSRMSHPTSPQEIPFHERLDKNGTVIQFTLSEYSIYWGTPFSGSVVALDFYFSDVNTDIEVTKVEVRIEYP